MIVNEIIKKESRRLSTLLPLIYRKEKSEVQCVPHSINIFHLRLHPKSPEFEPSRVEAGDNEGVWSGNPRSRPEAVQGYSERERARIVNKKLNQRRKTEFFNPIIVAWHKERSEALCVLRS